MEIFISKSAIKIFRGLDFANFLVKHIPGNTRRVPGTGIGTGIQIPEPDRNRHFEYRNRTGTADLVPDASLVKAIN